MKLRVATLNGLHPTRWARNLQHPLRKGCVRRCLHPTRWARNYHVYYEGVKLITPKSPSHTVGSEQVVIASRLQLPREVSIPHGGLGTDLFRHFSKQSK